MVIYDKKNQTLIIPDGIEGYTKEDLDKAYQSGYTDGNADGYNDGYSEGLDDGAEEQKALIEPITITENGTYNKEDGYNPVIVDVPDRYNEGYTSGVTDGVDLQKSKLITTAITENGTYTRADGYSAVTVDVPTGETINNQVKSSNPTVNGTYIVTYDSGYTGLERVDINVQVPDRYDEGYGDGFESGHTSGVTDGVAQQKALLVSTAFTDNGLYTREDGYNSVLVNVPLPIHQNIETTVRGNGEYTFTPDGEGAVLDFVTVNVDVSPNIRNQNKDVTISDKTPVTVTFDSGYTGLGYVQVSPSGLYDQTDLNNAYNSGYTSGETDGIEEQKALLSSTTITENGTYTSENGWSGVTVNVPIPTAYESIETTVQRNGEYTYTPRSEGAALASVTVNVQVPDRYDEGFASGHTSGVTDGVAQQKALLSSTTITQNGTYTRENGWSAVTVDVSGYTQADLDAAYQRGWNDGYQSGYTDGQAAKYINTPASVELNLSGDTKPVIVASNTDWTATSPDSWITVSPTSGSGNANIDIIVESGTTNRTGSIVITSSDSSITKTIVVEQTNPQDYSNQYLTFEITQKGLGDIQFRSTATAITRSIQYSKNGGEWIVTSSSTTNIAVDEGDIIRFRGNNTTYASGNSYNYFTLSRSSSDNTENTLFKVYGNIMSLISIDNFSTLTTLESANTFAHLFADCVGITDASNLILPATTLANTCYSNMFYGCSNLTTAPSLPATTLAPSCYNNMFAGCTSLTTAPVLPATTLANQCYMYMFAKCSSLTTAPSLPATTLVDYYCYSGMFSGCTNLTTAPELPATTLAYGSYDSMFYGCSKLNYVKCLATDISASNSTKDWLYGVSGTGTFVKAATMENWTSGIGGIPTYWTVQDAS